MPCRGSVACGMCASERLVALMYRVAPGPSSSAKRGLPRPSMYTTATIHAQVRRGPSGWTLGGRAGVSQPLGSAQQARDGTPLVCYVAPTRGQRDACATALPPRRTRGSGMLRPALPPCGSGMLRPALPPCAALAAYVQYNCFPTGPISSPPRAYVPRTPCASGWRPAATGAGGSIVQAADLSAFANHDSVSS